MKRKMVLVVDNVRSTHNVGSFFRTAEGLGVEKIVLCGITPYPKQQNDARLPYLADKIDKQITKTALGAEKIVTSEYTERIEEVLQVLKSQGFELIALEQTPDSVPLNTLSVGNKVALIVGNEVEGVSDTVLALCDQTTEILMRGKKESFNVSVAAGIALFYLTLNS